MFTMNGARQHFSRYGLEISRIGRWYLRKGKEVVTPFFTSEMDFLAYISDPFHVPQYTWGTDNTKKTANTKKHSAGTTVVIPISVAENKD